MVWRLCRSTGACASRDRRPEPSPNEVLRSWFKPRGVAALAGWYPTVQCFGKRSGGGLGQGVLQQAPRPGPVSKVLGPPVAQGKPDPLAGDAKMPLRRARGEGRLEIRRIEFGA